MAGTLLAVLMGAVLLGVLVVGAVWRLGIEFDRAWLRSDDGPLLGDTLNGDRDGVLVSKGLGDDQTTKGPGLAVVGGGRAPSLTP